MPSEIAILIRKRYGYLTGFLIAALIVTVWFAATDFNGWRAGWIISAVLQAVIVYFAFGVFYRWNLQKIHVKLRAGVLIKIVFWFTGLIALDSAAVAYFVFFEQKNFFWPVLVLFAAHFIAFILSMSVRYAIKEDMAKRKICEFC